MACISLIHDVVQQWMDKNPSKDVEKFRKKCTLEFAHALEELLPSFQGSSAQEFWDQLKARLASQLQ